MILKKCPLCLEIKNKQTDFYNHSGYCKPCQNKKTVEYQRANKEKIQPKLKKYSLKRRYNITEDFYNDLLVNQNNVCAICKKECSTGRSLAVDHCHSTNVIRGLLCSNCNVGLGKFKDDIDLLKGAIKYLERE